MAFSELSLQDKGWMSPPDSICSSSSEQSITSTGASLPESLNDSTENKDLLSQGSSSRNPTSHMRSSPFSQANVEEILPSGQSESNLLEGNVSDADSVKLTTDEAIGHPNSMAFPCDKSMTIPADTDSPLSEKLEKLENEEESFSSKKVKNGTEYREGPGPNLHAGGRVGRGMY